jgi:hypothetical protein
VTAVIQFLAIYFDPSKVVAFLEKSGELFDGCLMPGVARLLFVEGNDTGNGLSATNEYQAFACFDLSNARGEVLIGFPKRDATHKSAPH